MTKVFLIYSLCLSLISFSQIPKSGIYIYKYCDAEYNKCLSTCKVVIKGNKITIYATKELSKSITNLKEGDIIDKGFILKHVSGKWIIGHNLKDKNAKEIGGCSEGPTIIDFKKKEFWTC